MNGLAIFEQVASLDTNIRTILWEEVVAAKLEHLALWNKATEKLFNQLKEQGVSGKQWIDELKLMRRAVLPPKAWKPWITSPSFNSLKFAPHTLDEVDVLGVPCPASVSVSVGAFRGQSLAVGMRLDAEALIGEDVCVGIELCGSNKSMSVMMAPFSGHFYVQHTASGPTMRSAVFDPLDSHGPVKVWIQVSEKGAIHFLRQAEGKEIEDAGVMPPEQFPRWVKSYFGCMYCWGQTLKATTVVSVDHAGTRFPSWLEVADPAEEMDTTWHLFEEDHSFYLAY
jgi:hypothetical protein